MAITTTPVYWDEDPQTEPSEATWFDVEIPADIVTQERLESIIRRHESLAKSESPQGPAAS